MPPSPDDVTNAWLRAALAASFPNATFASLEVQRIGEAYGFASCITRYRWQDGKTPRSVVVKLWDTNGVAGKQELLFYQSFPDVGMRVPRCFYGALDDDTHKAILVLEDLHGATQGDVLQQLDPVRATAVARSLATLHATWLAHPRLTRLPWLSGVSSWNPEDHWFRSRRTLFLERFGDRLQGLPRALLDQLERAPAVANDRLTGAPPTLLHGDLHLDNYLFENKTEPVLLDWSRPLRGPAALNVAELLFEMVPLEDFDFIFECYLRTFNSLAHTTLSGAELNKQLGAALLRKFALSTCGMARWQPSAPRTAAILDATIARAARAITFWQGRDPALFSFLP